MAKFKVLKVFKDKDTQEVYRVSKKGESIELTVKRADEVAAKLGDGFLERIEEDSEADNKPEVVKKTSKKKDKKEGK